jgi:hypothetical protein
MSRDMPLTVVQPLFPQVASHTIPFLRRTSHYDLQKQRYTDKVRMSIALEARQLERVVGPSFFAAFIEDDLDLESCLLVTKEVAVNVTPLTYAIVSELTCSTLRVSGNWGICVRVPRLDHF